MDNWSLEHALEMAILGVLLLIYSEHLRVRLKGKKQIAQLHAWGFHLFGLLLLAKFAVLLIAAL